MFNKRGQFYLIAAITIILIILGLATTPNSLTKNKADNTKTYELFAEVNINDVKLVGYPDMEGFFGYTKPELENIFDEMTKTYSRITKVYILIKKSSGEELYIYDKSQGAGERIREVEDIKISELVIENKFYNFGVMQANSYYLIIIEQDKQQCVIKA